VGARRIDRQSGVQALALGAYVKLMRAAESVTSRTTSVLEPEGLSIAQFGTLEALYHLGPLCAGTLGRKILRSAPNMTTVIDRLEQRGLVRRARGEPDRRYVTIELTATGHALMERLFPAMAARIQEEMAVLSAAEQRTLGDICRRLGRSGEAPP
jgi:MarR family 2-MHQ and catechol resistance regulon transcriptional repressor